MIPLRHRYTQPQRAENVRAPPRAANANGIINQLSSASRLGQDHDCRVRPDVGNVTTIVPLRILDLFQATTKKADLSLLFFAAPRKSCVSVLVHHHLPPCAGAYQWPD